MKPLALYILLSILFTSCQYGPFTGNMTTEKPTFDDAVGIYRFDSQTFDSESINKDLQHSYIVLNKDGSFKAVNLPEVINSKYRGTVSGNGRWDIETIGGIEEDRKKKMNGAFALMDYPKT
jgi:hypothetical protein